MASGHDTGPFSLLANEHVEMFVFSELEMKEIETCRYTLVLQHDAEESPLDC
jgi:hypothetical protein